MSTKNKTKHILSKTYDTQDSSKSIKRYAATKNKNTCSNSSKDNCHLLSQCLISKEDCYLVNQVISFEDPYDKLDEFMVEQTFYEPLF